MLVALGFILLFFIVWGVLIVSEPLLRGSIGWFANRTAKFRYRDYLPVLILIVVGAVVSMYAGDQFIDLAELVHSKSPVLQTIDTTAHDWAVSERSTGATTFFALMSVIGGPVCLGIIAGLVTAYFFVKHR